MGAVLYETAKPNALAQLTDGAIAPNVMQLNRLIRLSYSLRDGKADRTGQPTGLTH